MLSNPFLYGTSTCYLDGKQCFDEEEGRETLRVMVVHNNQVGYHFIANGDVALAILIG